jgi:acetyl-CoA acetyltransferase
VSTLPHRLGRVASVVGIGNTDFPREYAEVRAGRKPHDSTGYAALAFSRALADAGVDRSEVDGLIVGPTTGYERMAEIIGVSPRWGDQADAMAAVLQACQAIQSGMASVVALVYGNDQRSAAVQYGGPEAMGGDAFLSYVYHAPWGLTSQGALYALMWKRHMELTGATEADLGQVSVAQRQWASRNPHAVLGKPITLEDYLASRYIAEPLHLYDYCMINDGGVALIIAEASRAQQIAGKRAVPILGVGRSDLNDQATTLKPRLVDFYRPAQKQVAEQVYGMASCGPRDIQSLQVYDSFTPHIPFALEGFGFCEVGGAGEFMRRTGIGPGGKLPVNTHGGHVAESYMQGWGHQIEAVRRVRGESAGHPLPPLDRVQFISDVAGKVISVVYGR